MKTVRTPELFAKFNGCCGLCGDPMDTGWQRFTLLSKESIPICNRDYMQICRMDEEWHRTRIAKRLSETIREPLFRITILCGALIVVEKPILFYYEIKALEEPNLERSVAENHQ